MIDRKLRKDDLMGWAVQNALRLQLSIIEDIHRSMLMTTMYIIR